MVVRSYWRFRPYANFCLSGLTAMVAPLGFHIQSVTIFSSSNATFAKAAEQMLAVSASLLGFIIAAVAFIYSVTGSERLSLLRKSASYPQLTATCRASMGWLAICAIAGGLGTILSPAVFGNNPASAAAILAFLVAEATLSTLALTWMLGKIIDLV